MDVSQGDVGEAGRQVGIVQDDVFLLGQAKQGRQLAAADGDVSGEYGRQVGAERLAAMQGVQLIGEGTHQVAVLFVETLVALGGLLDEVANRGGIGHEEELHRQTAGPVLEAQQRRFGGQVEPPGEMRAQGESATGAARLMACRSVWQKFSLS